MKKFLFGCLMVTVLYACGGVSKDEKKQGDNSVDVTKNPDYQKGLNLVAVNKCMTCHQIDDKLTGPPYREVANKYAGMPDTIITHLAKKVISGGNGV
ncbi:MAG TPA: c-type cytochrome, partial [Chitinophagaceae bacterium]